MFKSSDRIDSTWLYICFDVHLCCSVHVSYAVRGTHRHIAMTTSTQTKYYWVVQSILVVSIRGESTWVGTIGKAAKDYAFLHIFPVPSSGPDWSFARPILASRAYVWHPIPYNIIDLKNKVKLVFFFLFCGARFSSSMTNYEHHKSYFEQ